MSTAVPSCRICGTAAGLEPTGTESNGYALWACSACRTILVDRAPAAEAITQLYDGLFESGGYAMHRDELERLRAGRRVPNAYRAHVLRRIERWTRGRRLVEVGGGTGAFGVLAAARGWQYTGWDVSHVAVSAARSLSLDVRWYDPSGVPAYPDGSADAIVMWEVIEHIWDVSRHLAAARRALAPGGILVASTPNFLRKDYQASLMAGPNMSSPPVHVNFFTADSMTYALRTAGFRDVHVATRRLHRPAPTPRSVVQHGLIALGVLPGKTLVGFAHS